MKRILLTAAILTLTIGGAASAATISIKRSDEHQKKVSAEQIQHAYAASIQNAQNFIQVTAPSTLLQNPNVSLQN